MTSLMRDWVETRNRDVEMRAFTARFGMFGETERRTFRSTVNETRKAGTPESGRNDGSLQVVGHASVFGKPSVEMMSPFGPYTEFIDARAFDSVLSRNPDVLLTIDHNTLYTLARTGNSTLELTIDPTGLRYWARMAPTSYANDLVISMGAGNVSESSFLFRIAPGGEEWSFSEDSEGHEVVSRTIYEVGDLFDVCICAAGAYPDTDSGIMRKLALDYAEENGYAVKRTRKPAGRPDKEKIAEETRKIGDVAWGPKEGVEDIMNALEESLNKGLESGDGPRTYGCFSVCDVSTDLTRAIVCDWDDYSFWVVPFKMRDGKSAKIADTSEWVQVETAWVTTSEGYEANIRAAKIRREARMADETPVETSEEVETPVETEAETPEEVEEVEEVEETPETEEAPETETEAEEVEVARDAAKARLLAEARARILRAKLV